MLITACLAYILLAVFYLSIDSAQLWDGAPFTYAGKPITYVEEKQEYFSINILKNFINDRYSYDIRIRILNLKKSSVRNFAHDFFSIN